eukprot:CAMPEP_0114572274 /NCGR_PEP_ID=MMETSP0114-20121206/18200_1 /TAXON_ID=31324 /ORGANISM="Goniomonas sp, Strain m" /LENGTH=51 /DNA_ID=CAMNT_0001759465 /DNA_START=36 /DNA_END=191 /DNA_ORIENTATION=+
MGADKCRITYVVQFTPNGWIPLRIVELVADDIQVQLALFRDYAVKKIKAQA